MLLGLILLFTDIPNACHIPCGALKLDLVSGGICGTICTAQSSSWLIPATRGKENVFA